MWNEDEIVAYGFPKAHIKGSRVTKQDDERGRKNSPDNLHRVIVRTGELRNPLDMSQDDWYIENFRIFCEIADDRYIFIESLFVQYGVISYNICCDNVWIRVNIVTSTYRGRHTDV
jgi:hypothetical protein